MRSIVLAVLGLGISFAACSSTDTVARRTAVRYDDHVTDGNRAPDRRIYIQDRVSDLCDIPRTATFFSIGSSGAEELSMESVHRVADCMRDGVLKEEEIVVIGYTDPRGSAAYNEQLGMQRAETVAAAIVAQGIARERVFVKSYGESKATDSMSEADMARDRRVTVRVAQPKGDPRPQAEKNK